MMKLLVSLFVAISIICLTSCTSAETIQKPKSDSNQATVAPSSGQVVTLDKNTKIVVGQTIYVPIYPQVYFRPKKEVLDLVVTLSIRNTDLSHPIIIRSVVYYDSNGKLVKQYLEKPWQIGALASTSFLVVKTDKSDSIGPKFIVEWIAQKNVSKPIVEAVMVGNNTSADGTVSMGVSFVIPGQVIKEIGTSPGKIS